MIRDRHTTNADVARRAKLGAPHIPSPQQQAVMDHPLTTPALVDAGAGTGKTYTIVERVAQLDADPVNGCRASSILLLTFSKKAAAELRGRIIRRLGPGVEPPECATFHAFALSTLKEHAFELSLSPDFTLINEIDARVEFWKAFDEFMRGSSGGDASSFALRFGVIDDVCVALFDVRQKLRDRGIPIDDFRKRALEAADRFASTRHRELYEPRVRAPKRVYEISDEEFAAEIVEERARVEAAALLFRQFDERLRQRKALTYADLLDLADKAIRARPEVALTLRQRFRHCIVDEYQDTDPRQVRLLSAIFGDGCERVMVVGDPRQTIYGFRGIAPTNVGDFGRLATCAPYALTENRRSRQEILDFAHSVIQTDFDDPDPLRAVRGVADLPVIHAASRWVPEGHKAPNAEQSREIEAQWVAATVAGLLASGRRIEDGGAAGSSEPLEPRHIAILSRRKTKLQPLIESLNEMDLPFRQYGGAGFYDAPEVLDALAWFRLVADPLDDNAVARVLSSPGIGASDETIVELCRGMREEGDHLAGRALLQDLPRDLDGDARERIERLRRVVDSLDRYAGASLVVAWEATLDRAGLMLTADMRSGYRHDQARANLEKLSAMVRGFSERNPGARASDFIQYIRELSRAEADDQEADPPAADAINVMTIHAAKGLEWPIVFVIDVWPEAPPVKARVWIDVKSGALLVTEGGNGRKPFHSESVDRQDDGSGNVPREKERERDPEREREERRLFYVALTRARDEVFVSGGRKNPSKDNPGGRPHPYLAEAIGWIERCGWSTIDELPSRLTADFSVQGAKDVAAPLPLGDFIRDRRLQRIVTVPTLSFSSIAQFEQCPRAVTYRVAFHLPGLATDEFAPRDGAVDPYDRPPRPLKLDLDEAAPPDDPTLPLPLFTSGAKPSADDEAFELHSRPPRPSDSLLSLGAYGELVHRALELWARSQGRTGHDYVADAVRDLDVKSSKSERDRATKTVDNVILTFTDWRPLLAEAPFTLDVDDIAVTGFIDLILEDPDDRVVVVDYKTGITDKSAYALQLALYRKAAVEAYGLDVDACRIARISEERCELEDVDLPAEEETLRRVAAVAKGIRSTDLTARPGEHCAHCVYRATPCMDYHR